MPIAQLSGAALHYQVHGEGPPLLCVMGLGAPLEAFEPQARHLADRRQVIVFDNRGCARSSHPRPPWTIEDMARDALELLSHLGIPRADVLGVSMGGMIAQRLALLAPERVNALVLAATFARADAQLRRLVAGVTLAGLRGLLGGELSRAAFERGLRAAWEPRITSDAEVDPATQAVLDAAWTLRRATVEGDLAALGQVSALLRHDATAELGRITAPTLVLAGSADRMAPLHQAWLLARAIPGARLEVLAGGPHGMNLVNAPVFNAAVQTFLDRHSPPARLAG